MVKGRDGGRKVGKNREQWQLEMGGMKDEMHKG